MRIDYKSTDLHLEVKDIDTTNRLVLFYAAAFNSVDSHGDIIVPGAFKKSIAENLKRVKWFKNHDSYQLIGSVREAVEDRHGLLVTAHASKTPLGDDILALEADGAYEHSIGFQTILEGKDASGNRLIKEVKLWEVSSVPHGSNEHTPTLGFKSLSADEQATYLKHLDARFTRLQKSLRTGNLTDETCLLLEIEAVKIHQAYADLLEKSLAPAEPAPATPEPVAEPMLTAQAIRAVFDQYKK